MQIQQHRQARLGIDGWGGHTQVKAVFTHGMLGFIELAEKALITRHLTLGANGAMVGGIVEVGPRRRRLWRTPTQIAHRWGGIRYSFELQDALGGAGPFETAGGDGCDRLVHVITPCYMEMVVRMRGDGTQMRPRIRMDDLRPHVGSTNICIIPDGLYCYVKISGFCPLLLQLFLMALIYVFFLGFERTY